jgi:hypothetical protein
MCRTNADQNESISNCHELLRSRKRRRFALSAAWNPHIPCTPGPGGVDEEHRNTFPIGVLYMCRSGLRKSWLAVNAPPPISPPIKLASQHSISWGFQDFLAKMQSRKPGANRSIWLSMIATKSCRDPFGTRQYAQAVCLPRGARVLSNRLG